MPFSSHAGLPELGRRALEEFTPELFARSKETAKGGRYKWPCVHAVLVTKHIERTLTSDEGKVTTASKPQSVWEKEGYSAETLANCPRWTCPVLGELVKLLLSGRLFRQTVLDADKFGLNHWGAAPAADAKKASWDLRQRLQDDTL